MSTDWLSASSSPPVIGEPAWDIARLFPLQGGWSEDRYLSVALTENWMIEYTDGCVEVLPMPTIEHQLIVKFLLKSLDAFVEPRNLGVVLFAPLPVKLSAKAYREPDVIFNFADNHIHRSKKYYDGADLVMEIVSEDTRSHARDYQEKRIDYAKAGISEYWIVDPQEHRITVLELEGEKLIEHGVFAQGSTASSRLLKDFSADVDAIFAAGKS